jgi:hypothetical protein
MTKKQRRDKESSAKSHRKKINGRRSTEERSSIEDVPFLSAVLPRHRELSTALAARQSGEKG